MASMQTLGAPKRIAGKSLFLHIYMERKSSYICRLMVYNIVPTALSEAP